MTDSDCRTTEISGGQASSPPPEGNNRHGQLGDAVPMTQLSQPTATAPSADPPVSSSPPTTTTTTTTTHDAGPTTIPPLDTTKPGASSSSPPGGGEDVIEPTDKGKERATTADEETAAAAAVPRPPTKTDTPESMAIGPSVEHVQSVQPSDVLVCNITLLLTTGARHPYRIDERYLAKRNVNVPGKTADGRNDPFTISVYTLKELILREWREEWDPKPASPSSIRLIHFGKLLDDKEPLNKYHFSADAANVVHMTVRPADTIDEEEPKGGNKSASGAGRNRSQGSGCCIIL
ncbi:hypothetical protein SODALDRAFT_318686 [Sodiomyces alkalinus F11]|uniref:UBL3-like ubiquitin domain-containing protein n=1 Tax=Sodiomyces alkalinus (strain CBS 110278 / VKM F-3762 / F11) TaxID=1314773 RepID=A0A3N2Q539_SODAK|nr:hypothetical protein SODALDRAFT_318686 [Sodiomyces alkalinus F11]ROT41881.1 hypothetical protein SODALDRAFT_318686 [Sodiomyces alkalinus F11]